MPTSPGITPSLAPRMSRGIGTEDAGIVFEQLLLPRAPEMEGRAEARRDFWCEGFPDFVSTRKNVP
jgi:hypothetical protein